MTSSPGSDAERGERRDQGARAVGGGEAMLRARQRRVGRLRTRRRARPRNHLPLRRTPRSASSSRASATGQEGNGVRRTGAPPSSAGPVCAAARERAGDAVASAPPATTGRERAARDVLQFTHPTYRSRPRRPSGPGPPRGALRQRPGRPREPNSPSHEPMTLADDDFLDVLCERSRAPVVDHRVAAFVATFAQHAADGT